MAIWLIPGVLKLERVCARCILMLRSQRLAARAFRGGALSVCVYELQNRLGSLPARCPVSLALAARVRPCKADVAWRQHAVFGLASMQLMAVLNALLLMQCHGC